VRACLPSHQPPPPPRPPRLLQLGGQPVHIRLKPRLVGVQLGVMVGHGPQFIEHGGHIAGYAHLVRLGLVGFGQGFL
jgi:hypothetical protein